VASLAGALTADGTEAKPSADTKGTLSPLARSNTLRNIRFSSPPYAHPEIPDSVKGGLEIIPVSRMDEVLGHSLTRKPESIVWDETAKPAAVEKASSTLTAH